VTNVEIRNCLNKKEDLLQKVMKRKLKLFGHIARIDNSRKIKSGVIVKMDGDNRKGTIRTYREWLDDINEWFQKDMHLLIQIAEERNKMRQVVKCSLDTYTGFQSIDHHDDDDKL